MRRKNKLIKVLSILGLSSMVIPTTIVLASCGSQSIYPSTFTIANPNDIFANSNVSNGTSFVDATTTQAFSSTFGKWLTYTNINDYKYKNNEWQKTESFLQLELAKRITITYKENTGDTTEKKFIIDPKNRDVTTNGSQLLETIDVKKSPFLKIGDQETNFLDMDVIGQYLSKAVSVAFDINEKFYWIDKDGNKKARLLPIDFLVGLVGYKKSVDYNFNNNGYFLPMSGIDYEKTIEHNENRFGDNSDPSIKNENLTFTYFIKDTQSPYFLDILTKQYFFPMPHSHEDVEFLDEEKGILEIKKGENGKTTIDLAKQDWSRIYGANQRQNLDVWSVGPYYINKTSIQDVVFKINENYYDAIKNVGKASNYEPRLETAIPKVVLKYTAGSPEVMYNRFKSGELSYVPVPQAQNKNAVLKYGNLDEKITPLIPMPAPKTPQANLASYNMNIYKDDGTIKDDIKNASGWEKFIKNFHSESAFNIRKGLNELINWGRLSEIKYGQGIKDFNLSSIPYGVFDNIHSKTDTSTLNQKNKIESYEYYELISKDKGYTSESNTKIDAKGVVGGKYNLMKKSSDFLLIDSNNLSASDQSLKETYEKFKKGLSDLGFTNQKDANGKYNGLTMQFWTLSQANDPKDLAYFTELSNQINKLSNGAMKFEYIQFNQTTIDTLYKKKAVTSGSFLWSPDYNGLGTWVGFYFQYKYDEKGNPIFSIKDAKNNPLSDTYKNQDVLTPYFHVSNMWKPLYEELDKNGSKSDSWQKSLKDHLVSKKAAEFNNGSTGNNKNYTNIKSNLDTEISIWAGINTENGLNLVSWLDSQYPILPTFLPGLDYQSFKLVDPKYEVIININGDMNFKDFKIRTKE